MGGCVCGPLLRPVRLLLGGTGERCPHRHPDAGRDPRHCWGRENRELPVGDYDDMNAGEISGWLDNLSEKRLKRVRRDYEKRNKDRDTFLRQLDRKIKANS